jgi:hypothetical protein
MDLHVIRPILFVHRLSDNNIGDLLASPLHYFRKYYPTGIRVEVHLPEGRRLGCIRRAALARLRDSAEAIVVGGGGLIGNPFCERDLEFWTGGPAATILWGAGHNSHDPKGVPASIPDVRDYWQVVPFAAVGIRDWGPGFSWVPCASCLHPALREPQSENGGVVFAIHRQLRNDDDGMRRILQRAPHDYKIVFNNEPVDVVMGRLRNARQIVTNSYHCAYWATLLRKPVVVIGGGTKVRLFKHPVPVGDPLTWPEIIGSAPIHAGALEECCDRNSDFNMRVWQQFISRKRKSKTRPYYNDPIHERAADIEITKLPLPAITKYKIPKIVHFIFGLLPTFGGIPFNIMHYLAVQSVAKNFKPEQILFHHAFEPDNEFYHRAKHLLTPIRLVSRDVYNRTEIKSFSHRSDIIRLQKLSDMGGVYLDMDTITVRSLDPLLEYSCTIGLQGRSPVEGFCNAVIAAAPGDPFVRDWLRHCDDFSADQWNRFSVKLPYLMWRSGCHSINVEPFDRFCWPLWNESGLELMFKERHHFPNALCHHLWEFASFPKYFTQEPFADAIERVKRMNSTYSRLAAEFL